MEFYNNSSVRRQERLLDEQIAIQIMQNGEFGVLSMIEERGNVLGAYGIPANYVWDGGKYIYFHCALVGHKIECITKNSMVSFCLVGQTNVIPGKFTTAYQSVIIRGKIEKGLSDLDRMHALELILDKYSPNDKVVGLKYAQKSFSRTEILRLEIESISGKTKKVTP